MPPGWRKVLFGLCIARVLFVPLLLFCNAHPRNHLPVLLDSDIAFVVIMVLFSLSNGYLTTPALTYGSK
ncbi:equilibrative nucleoside transporter, putative [Ixodes scapularis]|uniref:Equilibrative nucleoside transporter, putative n=3 Tax=Ixodes scapularis TaxID=6945 RepID=B7Q4K5_IXOSC|nr:equilibrative nucleoside transporter, putative [Ixodes scapularis]|eukprot:XP_002411557.1 equilibrative nucleoside transporter, putative [Ixodes scapularis]